MFRLYFDHLLAATIWRASSSNRAGCQDRTRVVAAKEAKEEAALTSLPTVHATCTVLSVTVHVHDSRGACPGARAPPRAPPAHPRARLPPAHHARPRCRIRWGRIAGGVALVSHGLRLDLGDDCGTGIWPRATKMVVVTARLGMTFRNFVCKT